MCSQNCVPPFLVHTILKSQSTSLVASRSFLLFFLSPLCDWELLSVFFPIQKNLFLGLSWSLFRALYRLYSWLTGDFVTYRFECPQHLLFLVSSLPEQLWFRSVLLGKCVWFRWLWDSPSLGASEDAFVPGIIWIFLFRWPCLIACSSKQYLSHSARLWIVSLSLDCLFLFGIAFFSDSRKKYRAKSSTKSDFEPGLKLMVFCDSSCSISLFMLGLRWPTAADTSKCSKPYEHQCSKIRYFARLPVFILLWSKLWGCCFFIFWRLWGWQIGFYWRFWTGCRMSRKIGSIEVAV